MDVTVVIGFKNRSDYRFANTLLSLEHQTSDFECIIIDFGSSEENYQKQLELVSKFGFKSSYKYYPQFKDKHYSMGWAHNLGLYKAKGDVIFFVGSDTMISKNAIGVIKNDFIQYEEKKQYALMALPWVWVKYAGLDTNLSNSDQLDAFFKKIDEQNLLKIAEKIPHNIGSNFEHPYVYGIHTHVFLSFAAQTKLMKLIRGYDLRFYGPLSEEDDVKERTKRLNVIQGTFYKALMYHQEHDNDGINKLKGTLVDSDPEKGIISKKYEEFNSPEMVKARFDPNRPTICNQNEELWSSFMTQIDDWR